MRMCPFCSAWNTDGTPVCTTCGAALAPAETAAPAHATTSPMVLIVTSAAVALLLLLCAYLGSIAPPQGSSTLKQGRTVAGAVPNGATPETPRP